MCCITDTDLDEPGELAAEFSIQLDLGQHCADSDAAGFLAALTVVCLLRPPRGGTAHAGHERALARDRQGAGHQHRQGVSRQCYQG